MKKIGFLLLLLLRFSCVIAQVLPNYHDYKLETAADCRKADAIAYQVAAYLLQTPIKLTNSSKTEELEYSKQRLNAAEFLMGWMEGTSDYSFSLDRDVTMLDIEVMTMYLAAMITYTIENKEESRDLGIQELNSWKILLEYCENPMNNVEMTEDLKKISEANKKGELKQQLNIF